MTDRSSWHPSDSHTVCGVGLLTADGVAPCLSVSQGFVASCSGFIVSLLRKLRS